MKSPFPSICSCFVVYDPFNVVLATFFVTIVVVLPVNYVLKKNKQNKTKLEAGNFNQSLTATVTTQRSINFEFS